MTKKLMKSLAIAAVGSLMAVGSAMALPSLSFVGYGYSLTDTDASGVSETLSLGTALVTLSTETNSEVIGDIGYETIVFSDFTFDEANLFTFAPTTYENGFSLYDDDATLLMQADITLDSLNIGLSTATINSGLSLNLTEIELGTSYVTGSSTVIDAIYSAWIAGAGGAVNTSLNMDSGFASAITGGDTINGTYSGSVAPVPEPATMLLLGTGLVGLAGARRRKKAQK